MRVALVSPYDFAAPGGVTEHVSRLAVALGRLGHETIIIAPVASRAGFVPPPNLVAAGRVVCVPTNGSIARITLSLGVARAAREALQRFRPEVIHLHEPFMPLLPLAVLHHSTTTNVATFHAYSGNEAGYRFGRPLLQRFVAKLDGRIAVSETARSYVARYFPGPYRIIPNGVDLERFRNAAPLPELSDGKLNLLFVGRLEERKGFCYVLRAFAGLRRRGWRVRLVVVGASARAQRMRYERLAARAALSDLIFVGCAPAERLSRYYVSSHVVCAPSLGSESFGIVLLEAMAAGKPIVASNIPGYREVVDPEVEGLLVPPGDAAALEAALERLLGDAELRASLGERGRAKAERFAWPVIAGRVSGCYDEAVSARLARPATSDPCPGREAPPASSREAVSQGA